MLGLWLGTVDRNSKEKEKRVTQVLEMRDRGWSGAVWEEERRHTES